MKLSTKGRYALKVMIDVATYGGRESVSVKEMAGRLDISAKYLEQIIASLRVAGFLRGTRGLHGGYRLTRPPSDIHIGSILRATEGYFLTAEPEDLRTGDNSPTALAEHRFWEQLDKMVNDYVDSISLQDLCVEDGEAPAETGHALAQSKCF